MSTAVEAPFTVIADVRELTREKWLELRRTGIGGSDAGAVMGVSRWGSALSVWADKRGLLPERETTDVMEYGKRMEPSLRSWAEDVIRESGTVDVRVRDYVHMIRSTAYPWAVANMDGHLWRDEEMGGLELKDADRSQASHWHDDELPDDYYWQCVHYMAVTGWPWFYVFATIGKRPVLRFVPRNEAGIIQLMERERGLWQMVQDNTMPGPSGLDCDDRVLSALYEGGDETVSLDGWKEVLARHVELGKEIEKLKTERAEVEQEIKAAMGNAKKGIAPGFYANWSRFDKHPLDLDRIRKELPEVAAKYTKTEPSERFVVSAAGKKSEEA